MKYSYLLCLATIFLMIYSCKTPQFSMENPPQTYAIFTEGGGVTGLSDSWILTPEGIVFELQVFTDSTTYVGALHVENVQQIFKNLENLRENHLTVNKPGNMYRKIRYYSESGNMEWTFGIGGEHKILSTVYKNFKQLLKEKR